MMPTPLVRQPELQPEVSALIEDRTIGQNRRLHNNGLHQTGRGGVAFASRRRPVIEARPAGEAKGGLK